MATSTRRTRGPQEEEAPQGQAGSDDPLPKHSTSGPGAYFAELPSVTGLLAVFAAVLLAVGVTTDVLPLVARTAPLALGLGIAAPVFLLLLVPVFGPAPEPDPALGKGWLSQRLRWTSPRGMHWWRAGTGVVVATSVAYVVLVAVWSAHQATAPSVSVGLTSAADGSTGYSATVRAHRLQSVEVVEVAVVARLGTAAGCTPPDPEAPVQHSDGLAAGDRVLLHARQGGDAAGDVDYPVAGPVPPSARLLCVWAKIPRRCAWAWACGLLKYEERRATVRRAL